MANEQMTMDPEMGKIAGQVIKGMMQHEKEDKVERYRRLNRFVRKGQIVFAGSSLMEQFPIYELLKPALEEAYAFAVK